ncbi:hypothetical protein OH76DRAFT_132344 [Lentinus brumalis]|uniref:MYND-type domain-containing protein n=1 Tax=Lentinus brumalis TaxID=2498619 RepID=A0A371DK18_9APHY|nr:hypothetical protein OH76DRAFT_132344 [Polyporus brumalis]
MQGLVLHKPSGRSSSPQQEPPASSSAPRPLPELPEGDALRCCHTCNKSEVPGVKLKECGGCRNILYCSGKCQKAEWPQHKAVCQAGPPAQQEKLAQYGYSSAAAFSRDIRDYVNAHSWAIGNLVTIQRQIWRDTHPNAPITEQPRLITFFLRCQTTPDSHKNRNPATRFALMGEPTVRDMEKWKRDCPHWWKQGQAGRAQLEEGYVREYGSEYIDILSIEYFVPETNSCTMDFAPLLTPVEPLPNPRSRWPLFSDMTIFSMRSMNHGFPLRASEESSRVGIPGRFVRLGSTWKWEPLCTSWDEYRPGRGNGKDAASVYRELDLAISARVFWPGSMPTLMEAQAWYCTITG